MSASTFTEESASSPTNTPISKVEPQPELQSQSQSQSQSQPQPQQIVSGNGPESGTAWGTYLNTLNAKYQEKIRKMAQYTNYTLNLRYEDGREEKQVYTRMKLLQWQFDEIEDLRAEATELSATSPRQAQKALANMYVRASGYILFNPKKSKPMTQDEYKHCVFSDVRPALDSAMLLSLISDPN